MKKLVVIIVLGTIAFVALVAHINGPEVQADIAARKAQEQVGVDQFVAEVVKVVPARPNWDHIEGEEAGGRTYRVTLLYRDMPRSRSQIERDTKAVVRGMLEVLTKQGRQPAQENISVIAFAQRRETGETGKALRRMFGFASYHWTDDSITYKPEEG